MVGFLLESRIHSGNKCNGCLDGKVKTEWHWIINISLSQIKVNWNKCKYLTFLTFFKFKAPPYSYLLANWIAKEWVLEVLFGPHLPGYSWNLSFTFIGIFNLLLWICSMDSIVQFWLYMWKAFWSVQTLMGAILGVFKHLIE